ncbi:MAG: DNA polymerase III subunit alpha [Syntrophaceae bacterium]|nr:MAG: DNA polymerase III subunit alpha [Syntrophaceae bacterium]
MTNAKADFVHLHVHTTYSLLDSTLRLNDLFNKAKEYQMLAIAMTDHGNLFGAIEFYQHAEKAGIKPIIGCELYVAPKSRFDKSSSSIEESSHHLVVLVKNMQGYKNLLKLTTAGYLEGFYYHPRVDKELLQDHHEGLIATSACLHGEVASYLMKGDRNAAIKAAREYQEIFGAGNFYLEIMENGLPEQRVVNEGIMDISRLLSIPVVATNDCHYLQADDEEAHDALLCIQTGKTLDDTERMHFDTDQFYFRSPEEMKSLFSYCPEAISNTVLIADKCNLSLELDCSRPPRGNLEYGANDGLKMPAITTDFSPEGRDYIFRYVTEKYGTDRVAKIITFRKMRAKSAIRYVGRAMSLPHADVDAIAKMVPDVLNLSLEDALNMEDRLKEAARKSEKIQKLLSLSWALQGLIIHSSTHAMNIVISDKPLVDMVPLCKSTEDDLVTQYSVNDLKNMGFSIFKFPHIARQMISYGNLHVCPLEKTEDS